MSVFLEAIKRIDEIKVDEDIKPYFIELMKKTDVFFKKHNLMDIIDLPLFFNTYLFRHKAKNIDYGRIKRAKKLTIKYNSNVFSARAATRLAGYYNTVKNKLTINKPSKKRLQALYDENEITIDDYILRVLAHEFVHFLTIGGHATTKTKDNKIEWVVDENTSRAFFDSDNWLEAYTEKMALEILGVEGMPSYEKNKIALDFIEEVFDLGYESFIKRDFSNIIPYMSESTFEKMNEAFFKLFYSYFYSDDTCNPIMQDIVDSALDTYKHKVFLTRYSIKPEDFFNKQINVVNKIPYSTTLHYKEKINEINEIYVISMLEKQGLAPTTERVNLITKKLGQAIKNAQEDKLVQLFPNEIETCTTIELQNSKVTLYKKKNTNEMWAFDHFMLDYYHRTPLFFKLFELDNESYKKSPIFFYSNGSVITKNTNEPMTFYTKREEEEGEDYEDFVEYNKEPEEIIIDYKNGILNIVAKNYSRYVDLNNKTSHLQYKNFMPELMSLVKEYKKSNKNTINFKEHKKSLESNSKTIKEKPQTKGIKKQTVTEPNFLIVKEK